MSSEESSFAWLAGLVVADVTLAGTTMTSPTFCPLALEAGKAVIGIRQSTILPFRNTVAISPQTIPYTQRPRTSLERCND